MAENEYSIFPKPALLHFLHAFGGQDLATLRYLTKAELVREMHSRKNIMRAVAEVLATQPIYADRKFLRAWRRAFLDLPRCTQGCLKMRFYAMVVHEATGAIITESVNRRMTARFGTHRFCAENACIRNAIASRTDAAVGDCGHAPLWCLAQLWRSGYTPQSLKSLTIYEAGFSTHNFAPWISDDISSTCLQCQNEFAIFGIDAIYGVKYVDGVARWISLPTEQNFYDVARYALGETKT